MTSRRLEDLHPVVVEKATQLLRAAEAEGVELLVTSTLRTFEEQEQLYDIGRTKPGRKVTNARAGRSWHNFGLAFDVVPLVNGKPIWNTPLWDRIGQLGQNLGLVWGGTFKSIKDRPHFEYHPDLTLSEANRRRAANENLLG